MSDPAELLGASGEEQRKRSAVYGGRHLCETIDDVEEQEWLVDRYAKRNPGMVDLADAEIAAKCSGRCAGP